MIEDYINRTGNSSKQPLRKAMATRNRPENTKQSKKLLELSGRAVRHFRRVALPLALGTLTALAGSQLYSAISDTDFLSNDASKEKVEKQDQVKVPDTIQTPQDVKKTDIGPKSFDESEIKAFQRNLITLGYDLGKWQDDGQFGFQVVLANLQFQYQNKLPLSEKANHDVQNLAQQQARAVNNGQWIGEPPGGRFSIYDAIKLASMKTGISEAYLSSTAFMESSFNVKARAGTSSATGLLQFTEDAILKAVFHHGKKYGLDNFVEKIKFKSNGAADMDQAWLKTRILEIRNNPLASALIAAETTLAAKNKLERDLPGMEIGDTELYFAHFLGSGGATTFLKHYRDHGHWNTAVEFPGPAKRNKAIFYAKYPNTPRSFVQVYKKIEDKMQRYKILVAKRFKQHQGDQKNEMPKQQVNVDKKIPVRG